MSDIPTLRRILTTSRVIAVVGLSAKWHRPSYFAAKYLQHHGYKIIPVNPNYESILDERCYPTLSAIAENVDVVDVFQRSERVMPFAQEAINIGAKVLWLQLGVVNTEAQTLVRNAGLDVVMDKCMKIEHGRLFGGLNFVGVDTKVVSSKRFR